jgi:hypothetical protein
MDKKTTYYVIGAVVLVVVIGIVIAMQGGKKPEKPQDNGQKPAETKTETQVTREVGQELSLPEGEIPLRVTMDDNGQTASLTPGKNLVLMLGADYNWDIKSSDETVLAKRDVNLTDERAQAVYQIAHPGKAVLSAAGTCKSGSTCASPTLSFVFNVEGVITDDVPASDLIK